MEKMQRINNKKGFSLLEIAIVVLIIAVLAAIMLPGMVSAMNNGNVTSSIQSIRSLQTASGQYYAANGGTYTGGTVGSISLANLSAQGLLPAQAAGNNPFGGTFTVAPDANGKSVDISLSKVPSTLQGQITTAVANNTSVAATYTAATQTWTAGF